MHDGPLPRGGPAFNSSVVESMTHRQDLCPVSVVIPLYNKVDHVERAIQSVKRQTVKPAEIILIDDASTDGGPQLVEKFRSDGFRILKRDRPGAGGYAARNLGIEHATSEWVAFLDADDVWCDDHLETVWNAISDCDAGVSMVGTRFSQQYPGGTTQDDILTSKLGAGSTMHLDTEQFLELWKRLAECPVWTSAIVARRGALIDAGLFPERCRRGGDKDLWLRLALQGEVVILPESTAVYHKDSRNMVTRQKHGNTRHCVCVSVSDAIPSASPKVQALLRDIRDIENFHYAILTSKSEALERGWWDDFQFRKYPLKALSMFVLSTGVGNASFRVLNRIRKTLP